MKLKSGIVLICLPLALFLICFNAEAKFRGWDFGSDFQSITTGESATFERTTPTAAVFRDTIFGFPVRVIYHFSPETDGLVAGVYEFDSTGYEVEEVLDHYMKVKSLMDERYGKGMKTGCLWWSDRSENQDDLVNAFRFAEVSFKNEWFGPGVIVTINLSNELNTQGKLIYKLHYHPGRDFNPHEDEKKL